MQVIDLKMKLCLFLITFCLSDFFLVSVFASQSTVKTSANLMQVLSNFVNYDDDKFAWKFLETKKSNYVRTFLIAFYLTFF